MFLGSVLLTLVAIGSFVLFQASDQGRIDAPERSYFTGLLIVAAIIPFWVLYHIVLWGATGQTLGKWLMDLRVIRRDGRRAGPGRAFYRLLAYVLSMLIFHLGILLAFRGPDRRTLHDRIAGTVVVHHFEPWMVEWVEQGEQP